MNARSFAPFAGVAETFDRASRDEATAVEHRFVVQVRVPRQKTERFGLRTKNMNDVSRVSEKFASSVLAARYSNHQSNQVRHSTLMLASESTAVHLASQVLPNPALERTLASAPAARMRVRSTSRWAAQPMLFVSGNM